MEELDNIKINIYNIIEKFIESFSEIIKDILNNMNYDNINKYCALLTKNYNYYIFLLKKQINDYDFPKFPKEYIVKEKIIEKEKTISEHFDKFKYKYIPDTTNDFENKIFSLSEGLIKERNNISLYNWNFFSPTIKYSNMKDLLSNVEYITTIMEDRKNFFLYKINFYFQKSKT